MNITFYGAVREVTGSKHLVTTEADRILLDCGLSQGRRRETAEKNKVLPFAEELGREGFRVVVPRKGETLKVG